MQRRDFIKNAGLATFGAGLLSNVNGQPETTPSAAIKSPLPRPVGPLAPVNARRDRIISLNVCTRPFRAQGPRIEAERIGEKLVVHNYGHGGSGWSLSWGSSTLAVKLACASGDRDYAVIGCGALGLTSALLLQREGKRVTIYAKESPPFVRSSFATGIWSPDSRICTKEYATPTFAKVWEEMCRTTFRMKQSFLGLSETPVEWRDRFTISDVPFEEFRKRREAEDGPVPFGKFHDYVKDLTPAGEDLPPGSHPFGTPYVRRNTTMFFNLASYQRILVSDFLAAGGRIEEREFNTPAEFRALPEKTIIHATGYGARALFADESVIPIRGQLALLIPQPEVNYGVMTDGVSMVARRDGIVVQVGYTSDYNNPDVVVNRADTDAGIDVLAKVMSQMKTPSKAS